MYVHINMAAAKLINSNFTQLFFLRKLQYTLECPEDPVVPGYLVQR